MGGEGRGKEPRRSACVCGEVVMGCCQAATCPAPHAQEASPHHLPSTLIEP